MAEIIYLTVQDMLWINLQVTRKVNSFEFMPLEQGTFYQYAYGSAQGVIPQAIRFYEGFLKNAPFAEGNETTAKVGFLSFLRLNGYAFQASDPFDAKRIAESATLDEGEHHSTHPETQTVIASVLEDLGIYANA
ncbi:MAG TPA: hypothetical protein PKA27_10650 [Fimbriimonadaceae bacterium]|nr:hypothetical protein [Fimbriimonadaceae bacterium]